MATTLSTLLGIIALWWVLRFLPAGADGHRPMPYLIAFVRFLWIPSMVIVTLAFASRHWIVAVFAAILTLLTGVFASPWYRKQHTSGERGRQATDGRKAQNTNNSYTAMTLNCRYGLANPQAIVDAVRGNGVSILALQELTPTLVAELDKAGMGTLLPYCQLGKSQKGDNGGFNGIFSRIQPDAQNGNAIDIAAADVPYCDINGVAVYSAHPKSPMRGCREWSRGIINLATLGSHAPGNSAPAAATFPSETIIMGDLNSNLDHPSFRKLLDEGFDDAGLHASHGHTASFPQWLVWPRLELDHILTTSGIRTSNVSTLAIPGSDHFALLAQLRHI
ncbi:endonuclease/exonuclease/phosphatase family protein [Bifidobacterium sp. ESL0784]|uniref:endonuclease/exonuclease/phosphatase family protein n=1 Tax=Bifidobacterium sp. ESL0784 TaxID=2983231 RepID=UPI0023F9FD9C|nr:endonuclease/exonuclease/phosphatase family protein [Bifidobacterium sp. ESL0784]MDF7640668.1 endonuclease/exonuclease/phosphatase family protein [Bifidobacterium sp. ESL0784]